MKRAPWQLLSVIVAGWMSQHQQQVIDYLREENRVLRECFGSKRIRLNDDQRRRLAAKAKLLGRRCLMEVCAIVTPDTLMRWHRQLIARKYDGSMDRFDDRLTLRNELQRYRRCVAKYSH